MSNLAGSDGSGNLPPPVPENPPPPPKESRHDEIAENGAKNDADRGDAASASATEIHVLLRAGHSPRDVAARTGASGDAVRRVHARLRSAGRTTRRSGVLAELLDRRKRRRLAALVTKWLTTTSELLTHWLLRRAKDNGCFGNETAGLLRDGRGARPSRSYDFEPSGRVGAARLRPRRRDVLRRAQEAGPRVLSPAPRWITAHVGSVRRRCFSRRTQHSYRRRPGVREDGRSWTQRPGGSPTLRAALRMSSALRPAAGLPRLADCAPNASPPQDPLRSGRLRGPAAGPGCGCGPGSAWPGG